jgi:short-subunit dehydrogenase
MPYFALYSASKGYLTSLFTSLHYELKDDGVKVTTVLPGGVFTRPDIVEEIKSQGLWGRLSAKTPEFVAEKSLKAVRKNKVKYIF